MSSTVLLSVAIYPNPGIKHWSLYIETPDDSEKTIIHLLGARQNYFLNVRTPSDARRSVSLEKLVELCRVDASKVEAIKNAAYQLPIRNAVADYSCQDFVIELLNGLEEDGIIDSSSEDYVKSRQDLGRRREAWQ